MITTYRVHRWISVRGMQPRWNSIIYSLYIMRTAQIGSIFLELLRYCWNTSISPAPWCEQALLARTFTFFPLPLVLHRSNNGYRQTDRLKQVGKNFSHFGDCFLSSLRFSVSTDAGCVSGQSRIKNEPNFLIWQATRSVERSGNEAQLSAWATSIPD